jgi:hypothetical protein
VGFGRDAFTQARLDKLAPWINGCFGGSWSLFMATKTMYFPTLTVHVQCGTGGLDTADRMNGHSMTLAVRSVVKLYELSGRERTLHRRILGFSISYDDSSARVYGHYPVFNGTRCLHYRHTIRTYSYTADQGKEREFTGRFLSRMYRHWMPEHFNGICSAIDAIPDGAAPPRGPVGPLI